LHVQTPLALHPSPSKPQLTQAAPPVPQWLWVPGETHFAPLQQPVGHDAGLHTQLPATHA
jgi:hypothetical protein